MLFIDAFFYNAFNVAFIQQIKVIEKTIFKKKKNFFKI